MGEHRCRRKRARWGSLVLVGVLALLLALVAVALLSAAGLPIYPVGVVCGVVFVCLGLLTLSNRKPFALSADPRQNKNEGLMTMCQGVFFVFMALGRGLHSLPIMLVGFVALAAATVLSFRLRRMAAQEGPVAPNEVGAENRPVDGPG